MKYFINFLILSLIIILFIMTYRLSSYKLMEEKEGIKIIKKSIDFGPERKLLTALYREKHTMDCDHRRDGIDFCLNIIPKVIVVHMSALNSLEETFDYMKDPILKEERIDLEKRTYDRLNVSSHFLIDRDGTIYSLMPENYFARHAMGLNHVSIGIENVGLLETEEQVKANLILINYLRNKYDIQRIISHGEIETIKDSAFYIEKVEGYYREKKCGNSLAEKLRKLLYKE